MPTFFYTIRDSSGQSRTGTVDAPDAPAAAQMLRSRGAVILRMASKHTDGTPGTSSVGRIVERMVAFVGPRSATIEVTLLQMSVMLRSGLTLLETLRTVASQTTSPAVRPVMREIASQVRRGRSLTAALASQRCFSRLVVKLCEVGEQTGRLDLVLDRAADAMERRRLLKAQMIAAMLYPGVVLIASVAVTVFILTFAIPRIAIYLRALGRQLPPITQSLIDLSNFLVTQWPSILAGVILTGMLFGIAYSVAAGRLLVDSLLLRLPLIGYILRCGASASFARSMHLLLSSGITITEALRTCEDLHTNRRLALTIALARERVMKGEELAPSFRGTSVLHVSFMPMLTSMIAAGEKSGELDQTMLECAGFYEQRVTSLIKVLSSIVEIAVVLFVGGIVGYVYLAFMVALYGAAL